MDITQLILDDHHEQRRLFAMLDGTDRADKASLATLWKRLSAFLEVHAEAEERLFYPMLLGMGQGAGGRPTAADETVDAIKDHNEIRDAVAAVAEHEVGSDGWFAAVDKANEANSDHMGEEERQGLTDARRHASLQVRHDLGVAFASFEAGNIGGVEPVDKDPETYVKENERRGIDRDRPRDHALARAYRPA